MWKCPHCEVINTASDPKCSSCGAPAGDGVAEPDAAPVEDEQPGIDFEALGPLFWGYFFVLTLVCGAMFYLPLEYVLSSRGWAAAGAGDRAAAVLTWLVGSAVVVVIARSDFIGSLFAASAGCVGVAASVGPVRYHRHGFFGREHAHGGEGSPFLLLALALAILATPLVLLNVWTQLLFAFGRAATRPPAD